MTKGEDKLVQEREGDLNVLFTIQTVLTHFNEQEPALKDTCRTRRSQMVLLNKSALKWNVLEPRMVLMVLAFPPGLCPLLLWLLVSSSVYESA